MKYRTFPHGGEQIGIIGFGTSVIGNLPEDQAIATVQAAVKAGINYFDLAGGHACNFEMLGKALKGHRDKVYLQVHFGADYTSGEYGWTTDLEKVKASVAWQLEKLQTDYIDVGYIHCLDEIKDWDAYRENGILDYLLDMKAKGVVKYIGLSSHTPAVVNKVLDEGILDVLMFSINPLYDFGQGDYGIGSNQERYDLYRRCEKEGVAVVVMKPFCGGQLLDEKKSAFGQALSKNQCLQYVLDKPGVVAALPGYGSETELQEVLSYFEASEEEKDYSIIGSFTPKESSGKCVYCKHYHPCPMGLDVALINKYYDLAQLGDSLAVDHYHTLKKKAGDCISCGHCDSRCPFHVKQSERMEVIKAYFGE